MHACRSTLEDPTQLSWDGKTDQGNLAPADLYWITLRAPGVHAFQETWLAREQPPLSPEDRKDPKKVLARLGQRQSDALIQRTAREWPRERIQAIELCIPSLATPKNLEASYTIRDPEIIRLMHEGMLTGGNRGFGNRGDFLLLVDTRGRRSPLLHFNTVDPEDAISPRFVEGLLKAGIKPLFVIRQEQEAARQRERQRQQAVATAIVGVALLGVLYARALRRSARK